MVVPMLKLDDVLQQAMPAAPQAQEVIDILGYLLLRLSAVLLLKQDHEALHSRWAASVTWGIWILTWVREGRITHEDFPIGFGKSHLAS